MEKLVPEQADTDKDGSAAGTRHLNDITLDFGAGASLSACSALLRLASPVFDRMLDCGMQEAQQSVIKVEVARLEDFDVFYSLLRPGAWNADKVAEANVDALLAISDYYQAELKWSDLVTFLKTTCEDRLLSLPVTAGRLLQAHKRGLTRQYERCIASQARDCTPEDLVDISRTSPDIMLDLAMRMRGTQQQIGEIRAMRPTLANVKYMAENYIPEFQFNRSGYISRALNVSEVQNLSYLRGHIPVALEPVLDLLDALEWKAIGTLLDVADGNHRFVAFSPSVRVWRRHTPRNQAASALDASFPSMELNWRGNPSLNERTDSFHTEVLSFHFAWPVKMCDGNDLNTDGAGGLVLALLPIVSSGGI
ncbi:unnamed protein product [Symbiodinium sp. KB8]|nr:unnamed protein product [Symbiodinium sp. KB8]